MSRSPRFQGEAARAARLARGRIAEDLSRLAEDAGITPTALARACGLNGSFVAKILRGEAKPTIETYAVLATGLGADLSTRLYPNTGPRIRDRIQAVILEMLLREAHPRWRRYTELPVRTPARGVIDAAFHEPREAVMVASEIQSELRRLEQTVRWSREKADSLPSWAGWQGLGQPPGISQLLLVRRTRRTRGIASEFPRQLRVAYPAHPDDAVSALRDTHPWPGPALAWVEVERGQARLLPGRR